MKREVVLTAHAATVAKRHLLQHYAQGREQEDLCFGLWRQSTGTTRKTAIVYDLLIPEPQERNLHGNASFEPPYLSRVVKHARRNGAGLAFMHSHPGSGWQDMSRDDVTAERDVISYPARITGKPLVGLTIGRDGYWSARWWEGVRTNVERYWCNKVRVVGRTRYELHRRPVQRRENAWSARLRRTEDSWGPGFQRTLEELQVGIVGTGSVGCLTAEAMARIGTGAITLIDGDRVEEHNLDRLLYGTADSLNRRKVDVAAQALKAHATNANFRVRPISHGIQYDAGYRAALDCDLLLSCVDRPVGRDVLNFIAQAHLIPVVDTGVSVEAFRTPRKFFNAHWRAHLVTPEHQCLRCTGQYSSGDVVAELDGSLTDPAYIKGLEDTGIRQNMNTFPFALGAAALQVNFALRYLLGESWWPEASRQEFQFVKGTVARENAKCHDHCSFRRMVAAGDDSNPPYLRPVPAAPRSGARKAAFMRVCKEFLKKLRLVPTDGDDGAGNR